MTEQKQVDYVSTIEILRKALVNERALVEVLGEVLEELVDLIEAVREGEYKPDSFTCQPTEEALTIIPAQAGEELRQLRRLEPVAWDLWIGAIKQATIEAAERGGE